MEWKDYGKLTRVDTTAVIRRSIKNKNDWRGFGDWRSWVGRPEPDRVGRVTRGRAGPPPAGNSSINNTGLGGALNFAGVIQRSATYPATSTKQVAWGVIHAGLEQAGIDFRAVRQVAQKVSDTLQRCTRYAHVWRNDAARLAQLWRNDENVEFILFLLAEMPI